jgi:hypothetical protein
LDPGLLADPHPDFSPTVSVLEFSPPIPDMTLTIYRYDPDLIYLKCRIRSNMGRIRNNERRGKSEKIFPKSAFQPPEFHGIEKKMSREITRRRRMIAQLST